MNTNGKSARDIVIIGGGHNGLVTAFYLAESGIQASRPRAPCPRLAAPRSPMSFIPVSVAPRYRTPRVRSDRTLSATCNSKSTDYDSSRPKPASRRCLPTVVRFPCIGTKTNPRRQSPAFLAERRDQVSRVRKIAGQDQQSNRGERSPHAARYRPPQRRRSLEHAQNRTRSPQSWQARYVPRAALGANGRRRSGGGIFRNRIVARRHRSSRNPSELFSVRGPPAAACNC
jgi:hypothetical protein